MLMPTTAARCMFDFDCHLVQPLSSRCFRCANRRYLHTGHKEPSVATAHAPGSMSKPLTAPCSGQGPARARIGRGHYSFPCATETCEAYPGRHFRLLLPRARRHRARPHLPKRRQPPSTVPFPCCRIPHCRPRSKVVTESSIDRLRLVWKLWCRRCSFPDILPRAPNRRYTSSSNSLDISDLSSTLLTYTSHAQEYSRVYPQWHRL